MIRSIDQPLARADRQVGQQADVERGEQPRFVAGHRVEDAARPRDARRDLGRGAGRGDAARHLEAELALQPLAQPLGHAEAVAGRDRRTRPGDARCADVRADLDEHRVDRRPLDRGASARHVRVAQDLVDRGRCLEIALDGAVEERRVRDSAAAAIGEAEAGPHAAARRLGAGRDHDAVRRRLTADDDGPRRASRGSSCRSTATKKPSRSTWMISDHVGSPMPMR